MNETNTGPFKRISMPWFPFSVPATVLAMAALLVFHGVCYMASLLVEGIPSAGAAWGLFLVQLDGIISSLNLRASLPGGRLLFFGQCAVVVLLWAYFGVAISRCLALRLTRDEYLSIKDALAFATERFRTAILFPLIVAGCILLLVGVNGLLGAAMQLPYVGVAFQLLLPFAFLATGLMLVIFFSALFGSGMVSGAIAVECRSTLDAWGKALNYIFARPLHVIVYLILLKVFLVDILLGYGIQRGFLHAWTRSALSPLWNNDAFERILAERPRGTYEEVSSLIWQLVGDFAYLFIGGVIIAFAFGGFTAMFLILRRDVDGIDVTEIELKGESGDPMPQPVEPESGSEGGDGAA